MTVSYSVSMNIISNSYYYQPVSVTYGVSMNIISSSYCLLSMTALYEGPAKSFITGLGLLQCYVLSIIFLLQTFKVFPLYWNTFFNLFTKSRKADK